MPDTLYMSSAVASTTSTAAMTLEWVIIWGRGRGEGWGEWVWGWWGAARFAGMQRRTAG